MSLSIFVFFCVLLSLFVFLQNVPASSGVKVTIFVTVISSLSFSSNLICLEVIVEHLSHPTFKKPENAVNINQLQYAQSTKK